MTDIGLYGFEVRNEDVRIRFSCDSVAERIHRAMDNLRVTKGDPKLMAVFSSSQKEVVFGFGNESHQGKFQHEAVFFENTDYPTLVQAEKGIRNLRLTFSNGHSNCSLSESGGLLFGAVNFGNQVGKTDALVEYESEDKSVGKFVITPLERGLGITLGNAIRSCVLLPRY